MKDEEEMKYKNWFNALRIVAGGAIAGVLIVQLAAKVYGLGSVDSGVQAIAAVVGGGGVYTALKLHLLA